MSTIEKVAVIGLDCAEPSLVFDRWVDHLPNLRNLMAGGTYGTLESSMPPITVPAWSCMASSKDPGKLGIYGFRNRADHSYTKLSIATSLAVRERRVWEILGDARRQCIVLGVPGTYPITRKVNGHMVTCFLTPDPNDPKITYTAPPTLRKEIEALVGEYMVDVKNFRTDDKKWLLGQIYIMTERRFKLLRYLMNHKPWDLMWMVEMGTDRIHHGFWSFIDPAHHRYEKGNEFENSILDYYKYIDKEIGETLACMDLDKTAVWVVSDHGAKCMIGGFCLNQWLINEGYMALKDPNVAPGTKFDVELVDWSRTKAWGDGGYYGRLFVNVLGREPNGIVPQSRYNAVRDEIIRKLEAHPDHEGKPMGTRAYRPEDVYKQANGVPPDLIIIFGDLSWRSVGSLGMDNIYTFENDTGPDDANHAQFGMYILRHPSLPARGRVDGPTLYDVTPTILKMFKQAIPDDMRGRPLI